MADSPELPDEERHIKDMETNYLILCARGDEIYRDNISNVVEATKFVRAMRRLGWNVLVLKRNGSK